MTDSGRMSEQTEEQFVEQEMTILEQRKKLEIRITYGILTLLLCDLEELSAKFVLDLQRDLEEWSNGVEGE